MKKKIIIMMALLAICGTTIGCSKSQEKDTNTAKNEVETKTETKKEISLGEWNSNIYTNDFLNMTYTLPEGWSYYNKEEIAELMNLGIEALNDDQKVAAKLAEETSVYYMVASNPNTAESVMLMSEKTILDVSMDYYLNTVKKQLEAVESIDYTIGETSKQTIGNKEFATVLVSATQNGINVNQKYYVYKMDKYFVAIITTSYTGEETLNSLIAPFNFN